MLFFFIVTFFLDPAYTKSNKSSFQPVPNPSEEYSLIYIYGIEGLPGCPTVLVDGREITYLPQKSYTWLKVAPGEHTVSTKWGAFADNADRRITISILSNRSYFVELKAKTVAGGLDYIRTYHSLKEVPENEALKRLKKAKKYMSAPSD